MIENTETPNTQIEVWFPDGECVLYKDATELTNNIANGNIKKSYRARLLHGSPAQPNADGGADEQGENMDINWSSVGKLAAQIPEIQVMFTPKWSYALGGVGWGILVGIIIKALDTTITLFIIDPQAGMLWLFTVACIFASGRFGFYPIVVYFVVTIMVGMPFANFFVTAIVVALVGALFGAPAGLFVGAVVGHFKAKQIAKHVNIDDEGLRPYMLGMLLPFAFLVISLPLYIFWLTPKIMEWLA